MEFSELYITYYSKLVRFAREYVILEEDAENITQDVFADMWEKRESIDLIENMSAYLFRLVKNRCLDYLKHKAFEQKYVEHIQSSFEIELSLKLQSLDRFDICNISFHTMTYNRLSCGTPCIGLCIPYSPPPIPPYFDLFYS